MRRVAPNYAFLAAAGFALVAFAASLTTIVETGIKADVRASVVVDTYKAWHHKHVNVRRPTTVHAYNVTNLKAVLGAGAKPQLRKVDVALTRVEEGSDLKWLDGGDAYDGAKNENYPLDAPHSGTSKSGRPKCTASGCHPSSSAAAPVGASAAPPAAGVAERPSCTKPSEWSS